MHVGFLGIDDFLKSVRIAHQKVTFWKPPREVINKQLVLNFQEINELCASWSGHIKLKKKNQWTQGIKHVLAMGIDG
jgi:hypothetical protein